MDLKWKYLVTGALGYLITCSLLSLNETVFLLIGFALMREVINPYKGLDRNIKDIGYDLIGVAAGIACNGLFR